VLLLVEMDDDDGGAEAMLMCALDCPRAAAEAAWGTIFSPLGETRVTDLYLLDSPAGAIHSRGKVELHLVASG
jgi:hypothetical protein